MATDIDLPFLPSAAQIRRREFATVRRGYDPDQVATTWRRSPNRSRPSNPISATSVWPPRGKPLAVATSTEHAPIAMEAAPAVSMEDENAAYDPDTSGSPRCCVPRTKRRRS